MTSSVDFATPTATPDPSKQVNVTNSSGVEVCILTPTVNDPTDPSTGVMVYNQSLELLSATDGTQSIADQATKTFTLDQYYVDPNTHQQQYAILYNLLVSTQSWLQPVGNLGVLQILSSYPAQTVTAANEQAMASAATFVQTISAYPTSKLATDFQAAMSGAQTAASTAADGSPGSANAVAQDATDAANSFFQGTTSYQSVTLADFVAVQSYYRAFPFVWAGYADATFYLYASPGGATQFVGALSLQEPATLDVTQPNAGYACTFAPAVNPTDTTSVEVDTSQQKTLNYLDGLFVDATNPDSPSLAVKGLFMVKSQFTQVATDNSVIPVLSGSVNGMTVLGFDQPQKSNDKQDSAFWNVLFHPKGSAQIFQCVMTWGGAVMLLAFVGQSVYGIVNWARQLGAAKQPTMQEMFDAQTRALQDTLQAQNQQSAQRMSDNQMDAPSDPVAAQGELVSQSSDIADQINADSLYDGVDTMSDSCTELAQYLSEMTSAELQQLESLATRTKDIEQALDNATPDTLHDVVTQQAQEMQSLHEDMGDFVSNVSETLSDQSAAAISANQAAVEELNEQIDETQRQQDEAGSDDDPTIEPID